jgi:hypothetical protein
MTIRIDSVRRHERSDGDVVWTLAIKGLEGKGIYFNAATGPNGEGLYSDRQRAHT